MTDTIVAGNMIGTNISGTLAVPNAIGVEVNAGSTGNTIGGVADAPLNVISGNTGDGVEISGTGTSGNVVAGDFIGTDITGTVAIANGNDGVEIDSGHQQTRSAAWRPGCAMSSLATPKTASS